LDEISGIGEKRQNALLKHFGSIGHIKSASVKEMIAINGMNQKAAENVFRAMKKFNQPGK